MTTLLMDLNNVYDALAASPALIREVPFSESDLLCAFLHYLSKETCRRDDCDSLHFHEFVEQLLMVKPSPITALKLWFLLTTKVRPLLMPYLEHMYRYQNTSPVPLKGKSIVKGLIMVTYDESAD